MRIDHSNYGQANQAIRDILFMFVDMLESYGGFGSDLDTGSFDPFVFARAYVDERPGESLSIDQHLLVSGAAIAVLCGMLDAWQQEDPDLVPKTPWLKRAAELLQDEALADYPDLEQAIRVGLTDGDAMQDLLPQICAKYVRGYFTRFIEPDSQALQRTAKRRERQAVGRQVTTKDSISDLRSRSDD